MRSAFLLGGGVAGVVVGIALTAAFSSAADASPVPVPSVPSATGLGGATGGAATVTNLGSDVVGAL